MEDDERSPVVVGDATLPPVAKPEVVFLRHPHTQDEQNAEVGTESLLYWMGKGYQQVKGV